MSNEKNKYFGRDEYQNPVVVFSKKNIIGQEKRVIIKKFSKHTIYGELSIQTTSLQLKYV